MSVIASIDQGTTSTRCILFNHDGQAVASHSLEHAQIYPQPGWTEHDPIVLFENSESCLTSALSTANLSVSDIKAVGITNQRETTILWDKQTGRPFYNAIVWHDARTAGIVAKWKATTSPDLSTLFQDKTGLPLASYFSASKICWLMENVAGLKDKCEAGQVCFGTVDSWLLYKFTGLHRTDVTNASRTLLMNLATQEWDEELCALVGIPLTLLPTIGASSCIHGIGSATSVIPGIPIACLIGDQSGAMLGQVCFHEGDVKSTYGTGCFLMMNTGTSAPTVSHNGLLSTVAYKLGNAPTVFALEGSVAVAGSLIQWLRDQLKLIPSTADVEASASSVVDNGGVVLVPAFNGLFAPYWNERARGSLFGLTAYVSHHHICRAALEAVATQAYDVIKAMEMDVGYRLTSLKVDGGMTQNALLMQFQSDLLECLVIAPTISETTALGAAYAAGLATGFWADTAECHALWTEARRWHSVMSPPARSAHLHQWKKAIARTLDWEEEA